MARLFTVATDSTLVSMVHHAKKRLVIVAPGLSKDVASAIAERLQGEGVLGDLSITLDVDPEVCRLGYGEIEALDILSHALEAHGKTLQTQAGVRIGLFVSDDEVLVYSPVPGLIEAGSTSEEKPNAIRVGGANPEALAFACGANDSQVLGLTQEVGLYEVTKKAVEQAKIDLEQNPPRRFDLVRLERVFNYKLEFVEFSVEGYSLNTRSVVLPADLLGLGEENLQERLRNSFRVFEAGVPFSFEIEDPTDPRTELKVTEKWLTDTARKLRKDYFIPLGSNSFGTLILKRLKSDFLKKLDRYKDVLHAYAELVRAELASKTNEIRDELIETLFSRVKAAPPSAWTRHSVSGTMTDEELRCRLKEELDRAFGSVETLFQPEVICLFKGVHYETITSDPTFRERIEKHFGKANAAQLFSEYDASRAEYPLFESPKSKPLFSE